MTNIFKNINTQQSDSIFRETESTIYTNNTNIPHYIADRLIDISESSYGGNKEKNTVSATMFSSSIKQIILHLNRADNFYKITEDVSNLVVSVHGSIIHEAYLVNEPPRQSIQIGEYTVTGGTDRITYGPNNTKLLAFDTLSILDGKSNIQLRDIKTTSTFKVAKLKSEMEEHVIGTKLADMKVRTPILFSYVLQQSIYNLLYKLHITHATLDIVCMNWTQANRSTTGERIQAFKIPLATEEDTLDFITTTLDKVAKYRASGYLPDCTPTELGGKPTPVFKLVKNPAKPRAVPKSGSYKSMAEAAAAQPNFPGTVVYNATKPLTPFLCLQYCPFNGACNSNGETVCTQGTNIKLQQG